MRVNRVERARERMVRKQLDIESQVNALWRNFDEERAILEESVLEGTDALEELLRLRELMRTSRWSSNDGRTDTSG
jgi:hypothetical protein